MSSIPQWQAGTTYVPGACVVPTHKGAIAFTAPNNPGFETGTLSGWTASGTWGTTNTIQYQGTWCGVFDGVGIGTLKNTLLQACTPGMQVSAQAFVHVQGSGNGEIALYWYNSSGTFLSQTQGTSEGSSSNWVPISVSGVAPAGAANVSVVLGAFTPGGGDFIAFDAVTWSYAYQTAPPGLIYQATQASPGKSGTTEPNWPNNTTTPVTDNQVTWQGILADQIQWTAIPINLSGATQPTWPTTPGASVNDNGIDWVAYAFNIQDANCPNTPVVQIAASKIYAADDDIVRYSATANPLDWSSANNAGYLPFGLQTYGSEAASAMGLYRSNLVVFSAEGFQMWQVNEDPSVTALIDALPIATTYNLALSPMANDLLFLSKSGVRSLGIAASAEGLQTGDIGMPIDALVLPLMMAAANDGTPILSTYVPEYSQYWIAFPGSAVTSPTTVYVYTLNKLGEPGKWSRYVFPFRIDYFTRLNGDLYLRSGNDVLMVDPTAIDDFEGDPQGRQAGFEGVVQWLWLDDELPGVIKQWVGCDLTCASGNPSVSLFYDQSNLSLGTTPFAVPTDSVPGQLIPIPVMSPSCSLQVTFGPSSPWKLLMANLWLNDMRATS